MCSRWRLAAMEALVFVLAVMEARCVCVGIGSAGAMEAFACWR